MKTITNKKLQSWIPKKYNYLIQEIDQDSEVWEVVLKIGFSSVDGETVWVFGKHHYIEGFYTQARIKADLTSWLNQIEEIKQ
tara:strand:- start:799 stop:1044 length:246 start_codon:yes stop_codon:yes gene_type:complete